MMRKSLGTCVLLLGLLLVTSSSAHADTIAITSATLSNLQIVPTSGTLLFLGPRFGERTGVFATTSNIGPGLFQEGGNVASSPTRAEISSTITFASASGVADFPNMFLSTNGAVMLGCSCTGRGEAGASLHEQFMIIGGTGSVNVTLSALLQTLQNVVTDQFSLSAESDIFIDVQVDHVNIFSVDSRLSIGPNNSATIEMQRQLSQVLTLQFGQQYLFEVFVRVDSRAEQNEIPEPATVVLLFSGLGFMAGLVKKRRS
jgi:hypothetical protein